MRFPARTAVNCATVVVLALSTVTAVVNLTYVTPAAAATCTPPSPAVEYRAVDLAANVDVADGVRGVLKTPHPGEITGLGTSSSPLPSSADVALVFGSGQPNNDNFVQVGYYLGSASGLPYTTTPRVFWGESTGATTEALHAGPTLAFDTTYEFAIEEIGATGTYEFFFNGTLESDSSSPSHPAEGGPAFLAETDAPCTVMRGRAVKTGSFPLQWHDFSVSGFTTGWSTFIDRYQKLKATKSGSTWGNWVDVTSVYAGANSGAGSAFMWSPTNSNPRPDAMVNVLANKNCLTVKGSTRTAGTVVDMETCLPGNSSNSTDSQGWYTQAVSGLSGEEIINRWSGMCLVVRPGGGNGAGVVQETCDHAADQQWTPFAGTTQPDLIFKNPAGLCLAVSGGSTANGAGVIVFTCEAPGHLEQQWNPQG